MSFTNKILPSIKIIGMIWLLATVVSLLFSLNPGTAYGGNIALVKIHGSIGTESGALSSDGVSSDEVIQLLAEADENPSVKAIIIDINSGGGSGVAADEIGQKLKSINKTKVAVIRDIGASAAYWIASTTDIIYANRISLVGSIGVTGSYLDFSGFLERYNVSYQRYVTGEYKDMGSPFKKATPEEERVFNELIDDMNDFFIKEISENRNLELSKVRSLADGRIYLGSASKELGLIDRLGTKADAIKYIESRHNITGQIIVYEQKRSLFDMIYGFSGSKIGKFIYPEYQIQLK